MAGRCPTSSCSPPVGSPARGSATGRASRPAPPRRAPRAKRTHAAGEPPPAEATVIRRISALYLEGHGYKAIPDRPNAERAPAPRPRRPPTDDRPAGWSPSTVRDVLLRPDYAGELH